MTTTTNMGLTQSTVGTTTGPDWATNAENNLLTIDAHDHTSGKGVQLTPSSLNINADLEFNLNSATELKNVVLDNAVHASASGDTNNSVYEYDGNLYWRNASGGSVQITSGTAVNTSGGSISGMTGNAQVLFSSNSYAFKFDSSLSDPGIAKISHADIDLYKYDAAGSAAKVTLKFLGTGTSAALTVPDETGTLLTTATSFAGTINVATSSSNAPINLKPNGTGHVAVGNGGASGKLTSNGAYDLVLDTNSGTNSGNITITDGSDGNIAITPNGTGEVDISKVDIDGGAIDGVTIGTNSVVTDLRVDNLKLDANTISSTNTDGDIDISPNGTGSIDLNSGTLDLSAQTVDVTLNGAVDALNFDSNTLSIDASNNRVGVGTAAPDSILDVKGANVTPTTANGMVVIQSTDSFAIDKGGSIAFAGKYNTAGNIAGWAQIGGRKETTGDGNYASYMQFSTRPNGGSLTERMRIDSSGNVGIGTSGSPAKLLEVSGTESTLRLTDTDTAVSDGEYISGIEFYQNDSAGAGIGASIKAHGQGSTGLTQLRFATGATTNAETVAMVIDKDGDVEVSTGNLVISNASDKGITFQSAGGTGTSSTNNTLSEYERGTFSAKVQGTTSGSNTTSTTTSQYERIGNLVYIHIRMSASINFSSLSGEMLVTGLPFNSFSDSKTMGVCWHLGVTSNVIFPWLDNSSSQLKFLIQNNGSPQGVGSSSAAYLYVTIAYLTS